MRAFILKFFAFFAIVTAAFSSEPEMITAPFLQLPSESSVHVVWFTSFEGTSHWISWGNEGQQASADSRALSRIRKEVTQPDGSVHTKLVPVWRHEAVVDGLSPDQRQSYRVYSTTNDGKVIESDVYTLTAAPKPTQPLKILLTSDHQSKPMVAANIQKAVETVGLFDAVFHAGDLVELPDGHGDWFSDPKGFFPVLQGKAHNPLQGIYYQGAPVLQNTPIFTAIGNHEVIGRYSLTTSLRAQFNDPYPRQPFAGNPDKAMKDKTFNTDSYEEVFSLPKNPEGNSTYYATTVGEVRLIVLYATRIWRPGTGDPKLKSKYHESIKDLENDSKWGYGDFIFEPIQKGSAQYEWLAKELQSDEYKKAKLHVVMLHNALHTLGENAVPPFTDPVQTIQRDQHGRITKVDYSYPKKDDYLIRDIEPLLEQYGVDLVFCGHSHVWNRFQSSQGMHFLETSNVGNSYGAFTDQNQKRRPVVPNNFPADYSATNDPNGLEPIVPNLAPLRNEQGEPLPYISSNTITVFSVLDTGRKVIDSYYFDSVHPENGVVKFDSFSPYRK